jgi:hypothetical protein
MSFSEPQQMPSLVLHVNPGGLENGGGIGRMIGYMIDAWRDKPRHPDMRVLDTVGPGIFCFHPGILPDVF